MDARDLLDALERDGIGVCAVGDRLHVTPTIPLTAEQQALIRANKAALLAELHRPLPCTVCGCEVDSFALDGTPRCAAHRHAPTPDDTTSLPLAEQGLCALVIERGAVNGFITVKRLAERLRLPPTASQWWPHAPEIIDNGPAATVTRLYRAPNGHGLPAEVSLGPGAGLRFAGRVPLPPADGRWWLHEGAPIADLPAPVVRHLQATVEALS